MILSLQSAIQRAVADQNILKLWAVDAIRKQTLPLVLRIMGESNLIQSANFLNFLKGLSHETCINYNKFTEGYPTMFRPGVPALLEKCWQISLYFTDDAIAKLYVTKSLVKQREIASSLKFSNIVQCATICLTQEKCWPKNTFTKC